MVKHKRASRVYLPRRSVAGNFGNRLTDMQNDTALVRIIVERISSLPGIVAEPDPDRGGSGIRRYYLESAFANDAETHLPFAALDAVGRLSMHVSDADRDEIVRAGWAEIDGDRIRTFAARDVMDVTVLWRIVLMAYFHLAERRDPNAWREVRPRAQLSFAGQGSTGLAPGAFF